jgi:dihydroxyacetone kinase
MGRARPHAEKSLGTPDAGAVSMALIVRAIHNTLTENTLSGNTSAENTFSNNTVKENA